MTFKTFDELDKEAGPQSILTPYARNPTTPDTAGYDTPATIAQAEEIAQRSTFAAAFRQNNTIASALSRQDAGIDNSDDPDFDPVTYVRDNDLHGYESAFMGVLNPRRADAVKAQIQREEQDRQTLAVSGWTGTFAQLAAGVFDAPTLIPGVVAVRGAAGGYAVGRSMLMAGASAAAGAAASEGFLQASQQTRTASESAINIGAAAVLGSLLGGGIAAVLGRGERAAAERALGNIADIQSGKVPNEFVPDQVRAERSPAGAGADVADGAFFVDPIDRARTRDELAVSGRAASAVVGATAWLNPVLRSTQRYAASARQLGATIYESTIYRGMHEAGETTGVSVEAAMRTRVQADLAQALGASEDAYKEMRQNGVKMSRDDFYSAVGQAMRNGDESDNPAVARAAQAYRKMFDGYTSEALKLGLLDEKDLDVKTAASYFSRVYNRDRLLASEPEFLDTVGNWYANKMSQAYTEDTAAVAAERARYRQRLEDISLTGEARAARIDEIRAQGDALDAQNARISEQVDALTEARGRVRSAQGEDRVAAQAEVKRILDEGGPELDAYLQQRAELRARMRNLTERSPDAQAARAENIAARQDALAEQMERSLASFARRAKNALNRAAAEPAARAEDALASTEKQVAEMRDRVAKAAERANKVSAQYADLMDPKAAFDRAAERAAAEGRSGDEAVKAGTREADRVTKQIAEAKRAAEQYDRLTERLDALSQRLARRERGAEAAKALEGDLAKLLDEVTTAAGEREARRGAQAAKLRERAAKVAPEAIKDRAAAQSARFGKVLEDAETRFDARWGARTAAGLEKNEAYPFEASGRMTAKEVYDKITGKVQQREDVPSFITKVTAGPMKDRTFMVPDELLASRGWLKDDAREVANRYARAMAGEIELTRRFGKADMQDQIAQVAKEYSDLRQAADKAGSIDELNRVLGRDKFGARADLAKAKLEAQKTLAADETGAITDIKAGRDLIRGSYGNGVNNSNFAAVTRSLMHFNYMRQMGGVLLSNITDFYRPAMVHGLGPYLRFMPGLMAESFGAGGAGLKLSLQEAKLAGLVTERVTHAMMQANGDIADPFLSKVSHVERFLQKGSGLASRWNFVNAFTDAQQAIASTLSQHRVLEAVLGNGRKPGSMVAGDGERLLRMLGIDQRTQTDIADLFTKHGQTVDGIRVANTEQWLAAANATGIPAEIARAERAVRTYRAAINTDVNSIVSRRGVGDAPLFVNHPVGKLITQFSGYAMGAHSRVMVRGLQESHARLIGGLTAMTALGALSSYLAAWRGGAERWQKYLKDTTDNPALLIGEGLDRSGFFPVLFDVANRLERASGAVGYDYRFNPVKSPIAMLGGRSGLGITSSRASDSAALLGAIGGPSVGMIDSAVAAGRVAADKAQGKIPPRHDVNQAIAIIPFQSYYGVRELLQVLTGNSVYTRP